MVRRERATIAPRAHRAEGVLGHALDVAVLVDHVHIRAGGGQRDVAREACLEGTDAQLAADPGAFDAQATPQIDFAAAFGPVGSRWEAMLRWYEMSAPPVTH